MKEYGKLKRWRGKNYSHFVAKLKRVAKACGLLLAVFGGVLYLCSCNYHPDENKLIDDFHVRRASYERLRDMLLADEPRHPAFRHIDSNWYLWADW